ncbi:MAG TPA: carbohydrate kinase family protein [Bacillota bacterium]
MSKIDVIGYSSSDVDIVLMVNQLPSYDDKIPGALIGRLPGGTMANYACAISRLGIKSGWTGSLGDDAEAQIVLKGFQEFGVDTSTIRILKNTATMFTVILVDDTGERAIVVVPTFKEPDKLTAEQQKAIAEARLLYTGPYKEIPFFEAAQWARKHDTLVAIDIERTSHLTAPEIDEILANIDVVILNQAMLPELYGISFKEVSDWTSVGDLLRREVIKHRLLYGAVTLGHLGCILADSKQSCFCPGYRVKVVDTTGAGDCFNSAFTFGVLQSWKLEDIGLFSNAAGAISVDSYGARGHLPKYDEVKKFMAGNQPDGKILFQR